MSSTRSSSWPVRVGWSLGVIGLMTALIACGGSDADEPERLATRARQALAVGAVDIDASSVFDWAERTYPTLFPTGAANQDIEHDGRHFIVRHYAATGNYLGLSGQEIFGLGVFTGQALVGFGRLDDWACTIIGEPCLSGTVASGAAWSGARIDVRCARGSGSAIAADDGAFEVMVDAGTLPCALRATAADGSVLHGVTRAGPAGNPVAVHVTPMTDLVVAHLAGGSPATWFDAFAADHAASLGAATVQQALDTVVATLRAAGIDFGAAGDLLSAPLVPGPGGNAYGQALVQLSQRLVGSLTQITLADAVARRTPAARALGVPSLPVEWLLRPAAPDCTALRSGTYRAVVSDTTYDTAEIVIDAPTLEVRTSLGHHWVGTSVGRCRFRHTDGQEWVVSDAGVISGRVMTRNLRGMIAFPEQQHALSDLAGTWDSMVLEATPSDGLVHSSTGTIAADGWITALTYCGKDAGKLARDCRTLTSPANGLQPIIVEPATGGGFTVTNRATHYVQRGFVYRSGSGDLMMATGGELQVATPVHAITAPALGSTRRTWTTSVGSPYTVPSALAEGRSQVVTVDAATGTFARRVESVGAGGTSYTERLELDRFRPGYVHRIGETVAASDGLTRRVVESLSLTMRGMGLTVEGVIGSPQSFDLVLDQSTAP